MFTFALTGRSVIGCGGLPRVSLRLPWAMNFCPFRACPLKRALIERFSACEKSVAIRCAGGASKPKQ